MSKATGTAEKRTFVSQADYIASVHKNEGDMEKVSAQLGITEPSARSRYYNYRAAGFPLPQLKSNGTRGGNTRDLDAALEQIAKLQNISLEEVKAQSAKLVEERAERVAKREATKAEAKTG